MPAGLAMAIPHRDWLTGDLELHFSAEAAAVIDRFICHCCLL
jgi:hypothetical protein